MGILDIEYAHPSLVVFRGLLVSRARLCGTLQTLRMTSSAKRPGLLQANAQVHGQDQSLCSRLPARPHLRALVGLRRPTC